MNKNRRKKTPNVLFGHKLVNQIIPLAKAKLMKHNQTSSSALASVGFPQSVSHSELAQPVNDCVHMLR